MTDEEIQQDSSDIIAQIRDEMAQQFAALKESFAAEIKERDEQITKLTQDNIGLQRALVRSAVMDPPVPKVEKTEEEIYQDKIAELAQRTLERQKELR